MPGRASALDSQPSENAKPHSWHRIRTSLGVSVLAPAYRPRRPTETVLHELVREHLETFLEHARDTYGAPVPPYVEGEFREYLRCGVFAHGFVRARCESCAHELLVAFSCKKRAMCPSCAGRRMANEAAPLVDRVLPAVPVRQWVLSLPFELRTLAAFDAKVLTALSRIFAEAVGQWYRRRAEHTGTGRGATARPGAITFVQRFGSSLNLNVHFETCFLDGTYERNPGGRLVFQGARPPNRDDLEGVVRIVHQRTLRWLKRHGHLERPSLEERSTEAPQLSPIEACAAIATRRGTTRTLVQDADSPPFGAEGCAWRREGPPAKAAPSSWMGSTSTQAFGSLPKMISVASGSCAMGHVPRSPSIDSVCLPAAASRTGSRTSGLVGQSIGC